MESYSESKKQKETGEKISVKIKKYKEKNDTIPDKMLRKLNGNAETRVRAESQRTWNKDPATNAYSAADQSPNSTYEKFCLQ